MTDEDLPWRPSRALSLAPDALCDLEDTLSPDQVFATACVGADIFAVLLDRSTDSDHDLAVVRVDLLEPLRWTEVSRHGWWAEEDGNASAALAELVDRRRGEVPVRGENDKIAPTIVVPCRNGIEVLHLTIDGVALTTQLFDRPDDLVHDPDRWPSFEAAMGWVTYEA